MIEGYLTNRVHRRLLIIKLFEIVEYYKGNLNISQSEKQSSTVELLQYS